MLTQSLKLNQSWWGLYKSGQSTHWLNCFVTSGMVFSEPTDNMHTQRLLAANLAGMCVPHMPSWIFPIRSHGLIKMSVLRSSNATWIWSQATTNIICWPVRFCWKSSKRTHAQKLKCVKLTASVMCWRASRLSQTITETSSLSPLQVSPSQAVLVLFMPALITPKRQPSWMECPCCCADRCLYRTL